MIVVILTPKEYLGPSFVIFAGIIYVPGPGVFLPIKELLEPVPML